MNGRTKRFHWPKHWDSLLGRPWEALAQRHWCNLSCTAPSWTSGLPGLLWSTSGLQCTSHPLSTLELPLNATALSTNVCNGTYISLHLPVLITRCGLPAGRCEEGFMAEGGGMQWLISDVSVKILWRHIMACMPHSLFLNFQHKVNWTLEKH